MKATADTPNTTPHATRFVPATLDEIRRAEELRREIQQRYLGASKSKSDPYWSVGAD
jgi:hypothetical protein